MGQESWEPRGPEVVCREVWGSAGAPKADVRGDADAGGDVL